MPSLNLPLCIHLLDLQGYRDFLHWQVEAAIIFTDSAGIQEESTVLARLA